jgi:hypothetical protein
MITAEPRFIGFSPFRERVLQKPLKPFLPYWMLIIPPS